MFHRGKLVGLLSTVVISLDSTNSVMASAKSSPIAENSLQTVSAYLNRYSQNGVVNDSQFWSRSSNHLYLSIKDESGSSSNIKPGDQILVTVGSNDGVVTSNQKAVWYANSPDVKWISNANNTLSTETLFQATKPGIYTIQAKLGNQYTVPMVLVVGYSKLKSLAIPVQQSSSGVLPLPTKRTQESTSVAHVSDYNMKIETWDTQGTWVPVSGTTNSRAKSMFVQMYSPVTGMSWAYLIPVNRDHHFAALLDSPTTGKVRIVLIPDYFQTMNQQTKGHSTSYSPQAMATYLVDIHGKPASVLQQSVWASAWFDYNMSNEFNTIASTLIENSPSLQTAIEAISNWVGATLTYNYPEFNARLTFQQDAIRTKNIGTGICGDYANLETALLHSVGIPSQVLGGQVTDSKNIGHVWVQVWNGRSWFPVDPTFINDQGTLMNAWFGETSLFRSTHKPSPGQKNLPTTPSWE